MRLLLLLIFYCLRKLAESLAKISYCNPYLIRSKTDDLFLDLVLRYNPVSFGHCHPDEGNQNVSPISLKMKVAKDIPYQKVDGWDPGLSTLDIFYPQIEEQELAKPVIVFVHGGGWIKGDKSNISDQENNAIPEFFVKRGYILVAINFRLALNAISPNTKLSDMIQDIVVALKWVSVNISQYGGCKTNFVLWGYSSGSHLVSLVATNQSYLQRYQLSIRCLSTVIAMDVPEYDVPLAMRRIPSERIGHKDIETQIDYLQKLFGEIEVFQRKLSPVHFLHDKLKLPSFLLISSGLVSGKHQSFCYDMTVHFQQKLVEQGTSVRHAHFNDLTHTELFATFFTNGVADVILQFITGGGDM